MSFVTFPLIFSFVPYRLACWPPPPKTKFIFIFVGKTKLWLTSKGIRCFFFVSGFHCRRRPAQGRARKAEGKCPFNGCIVQYAIIATRPPILWFANKLLFCVDAEMEGGEDVSDPQVVHKPHQPTGTLASHQPVSRSLHTTALGLIVFFLPSKRSQIWKILISFLLLFGKKWFILIEPKGWLSHWNI